MYEINEKNELKGVIVPVVTTTKNDDKVDEISFRKLIRRIIKKGINGMFIGGSAGEGPLLTMKEWHRMNEIAFDENKGEVHLLGGVSDTSTAKIKEKIKILKKIGYKYFVLTPSFYITLTNDEEFFRLFGECKEVAGEMEMIAYNIPSCTSSILPVDVLCDMAKRDWIRYCKESSGDLEYLKEVINKGSKFGLKVLMGDEANMDKGLLAGACGIVPVAANYEPETFIKIYQAAIEGNLDEVYKMQERITLLRETLVKAGTCWIAGLKYALHCLGIGIGKPVSPLQPLSKEEKKKVKDFISANNDLSDLP